MTAKWIMGLWMGTLGLILSTSCSTTVHVGNHPHHKVKKVSPGQMKKMTGAKSAKYYAPGHRK